VDDIDRALIAQRISELQNSIEKTKLGPDLDKLITWLDHYKRVDRHLTGTAMH
jgi:F-type H+-transporting ATPase subunit epsilon